MEYFGMFGLAWANVISAFAQFFYLATRLKLFGLKALFFHSDFSFLGIVISALVMFFTLWIFNQMGYFYFGKWNNIIGLLITIPLGIIVYTISLTLIGFPELKNFRKRILLAGFNN